jgi:Ca2+-binding EF-hand superfamily protein
VLKQLGEKLSEAEAQELIKLGDTDSTGQIKYADLVRLLTTSYIN